MSRHTRRSLSLPDRMAAAGVDRVFVAEAITLALGYGSQRLTNSRLWSDNMALRTRAEKAEAERDRMRVALLRIAEYLPSFDYVARDEFGKCTDLPGSPYDRGKADASAHLSAIARAALKGTSE